MICFRNYLTIFRFLFVSIGHPILFILYLFLFANGSLGGLPVELFGYKSFSKVSTNVYRINLVFFIIYSVLAYYIWLYIQVLIYRAIRKIDIHTFINGKLSIGPTIISGLGYINLFFWILGMEGNVFGFIFALPLLTLACFSVLIFFVQVYRFFQGKYDHAPKTPEYL
jgi:hypothetical protein